MESTGARWSMWKADKECVRKRTDKETKTYVRCVCLWASEWNIQTKECRSVCVCVSWHVWGGVWVSRGKAHKTHDHTDEVTGSETGESLSFPVSFHPFLLPPFIHLSPILLTRNYSYFSPVMSKAKASSCFLTFWNFKAIEKQKKIDICFFTLLHLTMFNFYEKSEWKKVTWFWKYIDNLN